MRHHPDRPQNPQIGPNPRERSSANLAPDSLALRCSKSLFYFFSGGGGGGSFGGSVVGGGGQGRRGGGRGKG